MNRIDSLFKKLWNRASAAQRQVWMPVRISSDAPSEPFRPDADYMGLRVNQLFLSTTRQWFTQVEPLVFASSEYLYDRDDRTDAVVLGPKEQAGLPDRTVLLNQAVFGVHPYRGGKVTFTVVLSQMPIGNVARPVVELLQGTAAMLPPWVAWETAGKLATVLLDGFEFLTGLDGVQPILAFRKTIDPDQGDVFEPHQLALIDGAPIPANQLFVVNGMLYQGTSREVAQPLVARDFVLLEITRAPNGRRGDISRLPFYAELQEAEASAGKPIDGAWDDAKARLAVASVAMRRSPDLVWDQVEELEDDWEKRLTAVHKRTVKRTKMAEGAADPAEGRYRRVAEIMKLK